MKGFGGPSICSSGFICRLQMVHPGVPVHLTLYPAEHLFDVDVSREAVRYCKPMHKTQCFWIFFSIYPFR